MSNSNKSEVIIVFNDLVRSPIKALGYEIKRNNKSLVKGTTNTNGETSSVHAKLGDNIDIYVKKLENNQMKLVKTVTLTDSDTIITLTSPKVLLDLGLVLHEGEKNNYRRKTYTVKSGDTLVKIANVKGSTVKELVRLNKIHNANSISVGQVLKLPLPIPPTTKPYDSTKGIKKKTEVHEKGTFDNLSEKAKVSADQLRVEGKKIFNKIKSFDLSRGETGSPKAIVSPICKDDSNCIKKGDTGDLILELNIRLSGFGGAIPTNEFTDLTEKCVKQFQRDYMGVQETGRACGGVLKALDEFMTKYPMSPYFEQMKCRCGCSGFGTGRMNVPWFGNTANEYPGIHRSLIWALRAVVFYLDETKLGYSLLKVSSGYRCIEDNRQHNNRRTVNHMGRALDVQFARNGESIRTGNTGIELIRREIFKKYLGAQMGWNDDNKFSLETTAQGATTWVHFDVREYESDYQKNTFFVKSIVLANGIALVDIAKKENKVQLSLCGGFSKPAIESGNLDEIIQKLGSTISHGEGGYESYNTGTINNRVVHSYLHPPAGTITTKTVDQIINSHTLSANNVNRYFAVGKYQVAGGTMASAKQAMNLTGNEIFDKAMQERFFKEYLINKAGGGKLAAFVKQGQGEVDDAQYAAAKEWASIAVPHGKTIKGGLTVSNGNLSFYESRANHANLQSTSALKILLQEIKQLRSTGKL